MIDVLARTAGQWALVAIAVAFYAAVIWMIVDIVRRPHFSDLAKALWIVTALLFSSAGVASTQAGALEGEAEGFGEFCQIRGNPLHHLQIFRCALRFLHEF